MKLTDICEGYHTLKYLQEKGFMEPDNLTLGEFIKLVNQAERNILVKNKEAKDEKEQSKKDTI